MAVDGVVDTDMHAPELGIDPVIIELFDCLGQFQTSHSRNSVMPMISGKYRSEFCDIAIWKTGLQKSASLNFG